MFYMKFLKWLRNVLLAVSILTILTFAAGFVYLIFFSRPDGASTEQNIEVITSSGLPTPRPPGENAPEGVAVQSLTDKTTPGSTGSVIVQTNATSTCTIKVDQSVAVKNDPNLAPKKADAYGTVSWSWQISRTATVGNKSITITCVYHGRTGVGGGNFRVVQ